MTDRDHLPGAHPGQPSAQHGGRAPVGEELARLARDLQQQETPQAVLERIVASAVGVVPGAEDATITRVLGRRRVTSVAATGERARRLDELQDETGQGPCLDALFRQQTVRVGDLAAETRWPRLAERVGEIGARSMLCLQLFVEGEDLGALDLIASGPDAFDDESEDVGLLFAAQAAVALADAQQAQDLRTAMTSRNLIGQAQGILMERHKITAEQAFALLAKVSQDRNVKLRDLAEELIFSGQLHVPGSRRRDRA
ncbi:GAF and ANTAR domain-containing protein [Kineococcus glutinatus]|uniref:GAF and ANTAR domain-containing protein n=1 Tax=Kineococcus glutinatus TaxID=1070872 RepID=A0ABP9I3E5_9ACTN